MLRLQAISLNVHVSGYLSDRVGPSIRWMYMVRQRHGQVLALQKYRGYIFKGCTAHRSRMILTFF
jgi:hypothetical protein